jgi:D-amino-acid dehydrogenase
MKRVAVIGGGVIGLSCAWCLQRDGADVVVLERGEVGQAASSGNAGWITPAFCRPLPAPGVMSTALRWAFTRTSPFALTPKLDPQFVAWCWRFWRSCHAEPYAAGLSALLRLARGTPELFDRLAADGVNFELHRDGVLLLFRDDRRLSAELAALEEAARAGYSGAVVPLARSQVQALEPTVGDAVAGGIHLPAERHVRPESLTAGLAHALRERGGSTLEVTEVAGVSRAGRLWRLHTKGGDEVAADAVVFAAGVATGPLVSPFGLRVRQQPARGYSVTIPLEAVAAPGLPVYLAEAKVSCSPFTSAVRLAGVLELGARQLTVDRRRLRAMLAAPSYYLRGWEFSPPATAWAGVRPLTADGVPLIGRIPRRQGLYVATGHGMLGVTLAPATGETISQLVLGGRRAREPAAMGRAGP